MMSLTNLLFKNKFILGTMDPKDFLSEAHIMKKLRHPKLIQVKSLFGQCSLLQVSNSDPYS